MWQTVFSVETWAKINNKSNIGAVSPELHWKILMNFKIWFGCQNIASKCMESYLVYPFAWYGTKKIVVCDITLKTESNIHLGLKPIKFHLRGWFLWLLLVLMENIYVSNIIFSCSKIITTTARISFISE